MNDRTSCALSQLQARRAPGASQAGTGKNHAEASPGGCRLLRSTSAAPASSALADTLKDEGVGDPGRPKALILGHKQGGRLRGYCSCSPYCAGDSAERPESGDRELRPPSPSAFGGPPETGPKQFQPPLRGVQRKERGMACLERGPRAKSCRGRSENWEIQDPCGDQQASLVWSPQVPKPTSYSLLPGQPPVPCKQRGRFLIA